MVNLDRRTVAWSRAQSAFLAGFAVIALANVLLVRYRPGPNVAESTTSVESGNGGRDEQSRADLKEIRPTDSHCDRRTANLHAQILSALDSGDRASDPLSMDDKVAAEILSFPGGGIPLPRDWTTAGPLSQIEVDHD